MIAARMALNASFAAVGLVMFGIHCGLLNESRLPYTVTGTWMSGFLACFAAELLARARILPVPSTSRGCACCPSFPYSLTVAGISVLLSLGWFVGGRYDGGLWGLIIFILHGIQYRMEQRPSISESPIEAGEASGTRQSTVLGSSTEISGKPSDPLEDPADEGALAAPSNSHRILSFVLNFWRCTVLVLYSFLLGGCWLQAIGYRAHPPDGVFVTISVGGVTQSILTKCKGPRSDMEPTLFLEVGGGGHSMSDLWGVRDYIVDKYKRRVCSYDMPGTGWSDPLLPGQDRYPTASVITAMQEPGPFICLGTMDGGDTRCLRYCSANPQNCRGVVPVAFGSPNEFQSYVDYYGGGDAKQWELIKQACASRRTFGNIINFFAVSWGLIAALVSNSAYEPKSRAFEHLFLNVMNEKQWLTNTNILHECVKSKNGAGIFYGYSEWTQPEVFPLPSTVPVFGFNLELTSDKLNNRCNDWGLKLESKDCGYLHYVYNETIANARATTNRNPSSKLFLCGSECESAGFNGFLLTQNDMIPWFCDTLWSAIKDIQSRA